MMSLFSNPPLGLSRKATDSHKAALSITIAYGIALHMDWEQPRWAAITIALELNIDRDPDQLSFGSYLRLGLPVYGRTLVVDPATEQTRSDLTYHTEGTIGVYATVAEVHQLLLEYDMAWLPAHLEGEAATSVGGVALGYNVSVADELELINQVALDVPAAGDSLSVGVMTGFIATLPGAR